MSPIAEIKGERSVNFPGDLDICYEDHDKTVLLPDNPAAAKTLNEIFRQHPDASLTLTCDIHGYVTVERRTVPSITIRTGNSRVSEPAT